MIGNILPNTDRSKERNRDHARKTRLRKKVALDNMKERVGQLQMEVAGSAHVLTLIVD